MILEVVKIDKKYWLKIGKKEDIECLENEGYQGLSYKSAKFRPENYSSEDIKKGGLMIVYTKKDANEKKMLFYLGKISRIKRGTEDKGDEWVHLIYLEPLHDKGHLIGKIEKWDKLQEQLTFWKKYNNIGSALRCSMIEIGKEDFTSIVHFFNNDLVID